MAHVRHARAYHRLYDWSGSAHVQGLHCHTCAVLTLCYLPGHKHCGRCQPGKSSFFVVVAVNGVSATICTSWLLLTRVVHRPCRNSQAPQVSQHCTQTLGTIHPARRSCTHHPLISVCSLDSPSPRSHGSLYPSYLRRHWASPFKTALKRVDNWHGWPHQPH